MTNSWFSVQLINEKPQIIQEYESGKAIPNQQILTKLERTLGAKLRGKKWSEICRKLLPVLLMLSFVVWVFRIGGIYELVLLLSWLVYWKCLWQFLFVIAINLWGCLWLALNCVSSAYCIISWKCHCQLLRYSHLLTLCWEWFAQ